MILKIEGCQNAYDISKSTNIEFHEFQKDIQIKHVFANRFTLNHMYFPSYVFGKETTYTIVNKIKDGIIFINKWC